MESLKNFQLKSMLQLVVVLLYVTSVVFTADLLPNYSDPVNKIVFFDERDEIPLFLTCTRNPSDSPYTLKWQKNGKDLDKVSDLANRFNVTTNGLVINEPTVNDAGNYRCYVPNTAEEANIEVVANVYVAPLPAKTNAVRTTNVELHCNVRGTKPKIEWTINGSEIANNTRIKFAKDPQNNVNAKLIIENIERDDQNTYNCTATNKATEFEINGAKKYTEAKTGTFVKVRGTVWGRVMKIPPFYWFS